MPVQETANTVTVGSICLSCALYATKTCPYGNHQRASVGQFQGDIRGKCIYYMPITEAKDNKMVKESSIDKESAILKESDLNISLFKKLYAMPDKQREKLFEFWDKIFPSDYAAEMVTDDIETGQWYINFKPPKKMKDKKRKKRQK